MLIYPTLHYQNGGVEFSQDEKTNVPGLFVAGEVGGGIHHDANRLMATPCSTPQSRPQPQLRLGGLCPPRQSVDDRC